MNSDLPGAETQNYTVNISELINNDAVWRVVTNGYPYLTANQMGLDNPYDAYVVTKMAVYCVLGQSNIDNFSYDEADAIGHRMYDVLKYLVDKGLNGTETRQNGTLDIKKENYLGEYGDYYYFEYNVSSRIDMMNYEVTNLNGLPTGTFIANTTNNPQTVFNYGENFRVLIPKSGLTDDVDGKVDIKSKVKNYPIFYGEAPAGMQNYIITYDTYGDETCSINCNLKTNSGKLKVVKIDGETLNPIEGVEFKLKSEDPEIFYIGVTNNNGEAFFENLYPGKYTLVETKTGNNYIINSEKFDINIEYNKQSEFIVKNNIKRGKVKVIKKDYDTQLPIEGVSFDILDSNTKEILETITTDKDGIAVSGELRIDRDYILKENWKNEEYVKNEKEYPFKVNSDNIIEISINNEKVKGRLKIVKLDSNNKNIKLSNVEFELYDENMNLLENLKTNNEGEAISKEYPSKNKIYYLKEIKTKDGYILDSNVKQINLIDNDTLEYFVYNDKDIPKKPDEPDIPKDEPTPVTEKKVKKLPKTGM